MKRMLDDDDVSDDLDDEEEEDDQEQDEEDSEDEREMEELVNQLKKRKRGESNSDDEEEDLEDDEDEDNNVSENEDGEGMDMTSIFEQPKKKQHKIGTANAMNARNQQVVWTELMKIWIKMETITMRIRNDLESNEGKLNLDGLQGLVESLIELQTTMMSKGRSEIVEIYNDIKDDVASAKSAKDQFLLLENAAWEEFHKSVIEKWWSRINAASGIHQKKLKTIAQSPLEQLESILKYRTTRNQQNAETDIKNLLDGDKLFYEQMLKEFAASDITSLNTSVSGATTSAMLKESLGFSSTVGGRMAILQKVLKNKQKANVDTKASKGRKIRYDVNEKLVNFMAAKTASLVNYTPVSVIGKLFRD